MSRQLKRWSPWILAALIAAGLSFGATRAFARDASLGCPDDGVNWFGVCESPENCNFLCRQAHSGEPDAMGSCTPIGNCCRCLY